MSWSGAVFGFRLERGQPAVRILEYVRAHPIDLVVIPAGGTSRPVGSVADQVFAEASCPVWLRCAAVRRPAWMPAGSVAHSNWASVTRLC